MPGWSIGQALDLRRPKPRLASSESLGIPGDGRADALPESKDGHLAWTYWKPVLNQDWYTLV